MKAMSSAAPRAPIRHLIGTQLLLVVQTALVLRSSTVPEGPLRAMMIVTALVALAGLVAAIGGEPGQNGMEEARS